LKENYRPHKTNASNLFGDSEEVLYVKGSGWDLATIEGQA